MNIVKVIFHGLVLLMLVACSAPMQMQSGWYRGVVRIDGKLDDWDGLWRFPENGKLALAAKNDGQDMYLAVKTQDKRIIQNIATSGFEVLIDRKGGQKGRYRLQFTGNVSPSVYNRMTLSTDLHEDMINKALTQALMGPLKLRSVNYQGNMQEFTARGSSFSSYKEGEWSCEFKVPMSGLKTMPAPGSKIGVGFSAYFPPPSPRSITVLQPGPTETIITEWWVKLTLASPPK